MADTAAHPTSRPTAVHPPVGGPLPDDASDRDLVQATRQGNREAAGRLVDRYLSALVCFARYLRVPEPMVDDVVQETFAKAFTSLDQWDPNRSLSNWLMTIARNLYYDIGRKHVREQKHVAFEMPESVPGVADQAIARVTLDEALSRLSDDGRLMLELRVFLDLPFSEIAQILDENETTLRVRFHRVLQELRRCEAREVAHGA